MMTEFHDYILSGNDRITIRCKSKNLDLVSWCDQKLIASIPREGTCTVKCICGSRYEVRPPEKDSAEVVVMAQVT